MLISIGDVVGQAFLIGIGIHQDNPLPVTRSLDAKVHCKCGFSGPTLHATYQELHVAFLLTYLTGPIEAPNVPN